MGQLGCFICEDRIYSFPNKFIFPTGSGIGFFLAVAIPLNLPNKSVYMSYNFQANYPLPDSSYVDYPPLIERTSREKIQRKASIGRTLVYELLESKFETNGFPGRSCLLRAICEAATMVVHHNGLLGDLLHILLTPSTTSNDKDLLLDYALAEDFGKFYGCSQYKENCTNNVLDLISWIG